MFSKDFDRALEIIYRRLNNQNILWALTGSTSFALQGMNIIPKDIDIQTDESGAYKIGALLREYEISPVLFSQTDIIRSHFGRFVIKGVNVEIMGDIQKKYKGEWEDIMDLTAFTERISYKGMNMPVLHLSYERCAYKKLGRFDRSLEIGSFLKSKINPK